MNRKLYTVRLEHEVVVYASDAAEAEDAARSAVHEIYEWDYTIDEMDHLPWGWEGGEIPFVDTEECNPDEKTIDALIAEGAAPRLAKKREQTAKRRAEAKAAEAACATPSGGVPNE